MILIGLGANLSGPWGTPAAAIGRALIRLTERELVVRARSRLYDSAPWPPSHQARYVNAVARVDTSLSPAKLLAVLHGIEAEAGRVRGAANAARTLDLDLLDYDGRIEDGPPHVPHPRLHERGFVLSPLSEVAPEWRHPVTGEGIATLIARLLPEAQATPI
jgi:2-amino-4-hydroxy-6-hydroxymethyldihydropteridine diphosphokinase